MNKLLKTQFAKIFTLFRPETVDRFSPEINAMLKFFIYWLSVYKVGYTYGELLQNLKYCNENERQKQHETSTIGPPISRFQKISFGVLSIGGEWLWQRLSRISIDYAWSEQPTEDWRNQLWQLMNQSETIFKLLSLINFLTFLYNGKYRSIVERILSMRLIFYRPLMDRRVNFEYMNRQLVWHGFTEFLIFILPLINVDQLKSFISRRILLAVRRNNNTNQQPNIPENICPICRSNPINTPYRANCRCIYCYYCIRSSLMADKNFQCLRCEAVIRDIHRLEIA